MKVSIGILMDFFVPGVIDGAGAYGREHGIVIDPRWAVRADWMPARPDWDGVLVSLVDRSDLWKRVHALGVPVINLSSRAPDLFPKVEIHFAACGRRALSEAADRGIHEVLLIEHPGEPVTVAFNRGVCCEARKREVSLRWLRSWDGRADLDENARRIAAELAQVEGRPALLAAHAGVVYSVLNELRGLDCQVPEDLAIIVLDKDIQRSPEMAPVPLAVVRPDFWQQGYLAARTLHRMISGEHFAERHLIRIKSCDFVERESIGTPTTRDPFVMKVLHGLREGELCRLSVDGLVRYAGQSRRTIEQRFKKETGTTLHRAILKRRIEEATRMLKTADLTVGEVADACGFASLHYFSAAYKRETGKTPGSVKRGG